MKYYDEKPAKNLNEKPPITDDDDDIDLGLPSVPNTHPDPSEKTNYNNSNSSNNVGSASIDYDELTKRFQNLKQFK